MATIWSGSVPSGPSLECEFLPPLDLGDDAEVSWNIPWEQQLRVVAAWQEALASHDGGSAGRIKPGYPGH